jgi:signal transduction histidine kinase
MAALRNRHGCGPWAQLLLIGAHAVGILRCGRRDVDVLWSIMDRDLLHDLTERVKELTALHATSRVLQDRTKPASQVIERVVALLPPAWQYPEVTVARIRLGSLEAATPDFRVTKWRQAASFGICGGKAGQIEVCYLDERRPADEGPFLSEERDLIESLAEMLGSYFQQMHDYKAMRKAHSDLERQVAERTAELRATNATLANQVSECRRAQGRIDAYEHQLRQLASELSLAEARERREIAEDLHDHIGQALAFTRMSVAEFRGNAIFCGFESKIDEILTLLDQTIRYTRNLTFTISPPALYELGLEAALGTLAERFHSKHGLDVETEIPSGIGRLGEDVVVLLYKSVQELLTNVVKHAGARNSVIRVTDRGDHVRVEVEDSGRGFDPTALESGCGGDHFGLLTIRERIRHLGGTTEIRSVPGRGTSVVLLIPTERGGP